MTPETILLRQAHPHFFPNGNLSREAFLPDKEDPNLSTYNGDDINAPDSFVHYTTVLNLEARSTWGVSCGEVSGEGFTSRPDPNPDGIPNHPHHCVIEYGNLGINALRRAAKKMKEHALKRGQLHPPLAKEASQT